MVQGSRHAGQWSFDDQTLPRPQPRTQAAEVVSPYQGEVGLTEIGERLRAAGASMIVVDCMGFTQPNKELLRRAAGVPVILASSMLARFIAEAA